MPDDLASAMQARGDLGPRIQHKNGRLEVDGDATDPDRPNHATIKRARVKCHYDVLFFTGGLTKAEREAADRYAVTCEREAGARERQDGPSQHSAPWSRAPALTAVQASASLRAVHAVVGTDGTALLRLYVRDNTSCAEIARRRAERQEMTMGRIRAALSRAAEHWGME